MTGSTALPVFDRIVVVDWSSANSPKRGKDSIWIADSHAPSVNPATRAAAMERISAIIDDSLLRTERVLIGFDFAFGYPAGFAEALGVNGWRGLWAWLHARIKDAGNNRSNRFEIGAVMNGVLGEGHGPFWGHTGHGRPPGLSPKRYHDGQRQWAFPFPYWREVERHAKGAKSVFQLAYPGCVGSQSLLGIARLESLRRMFPEAIAIWPFETDFADDLSAPVTLAEIYPSSHRVPDGPEVKDQRQVDAVLRDFQNWTQSGEIITKLSAPTLTKEARRKVSAEEGWVVGI